MTDNEFEPCISCENKVCETDRKLCTHSIRRENWNLTQKDFDNCLHVTRSGTEACPTCVARKVCKLTKYRED